MDNEFQCQVIAVELKPQRWETASAVVDNQTSIRAVDRSAGVLLSTSEPTY